jgi:hypothetical protein
MAINGTEKNTLATKYGTDATHVALFTADPGTTGTATGEVTGGSYARKPITWGAVSNGVITGTVANIDVPASTITHIGLCGGLTGANVIDRIALGTAVVFSVAGQAVISPLTFTQV